MSDQNSQTPGTPGPAQPAVDEITDKDFLKALSVSYTKNCEKLIFIIGKYFLTEYLKGTLNVENDFNKIKSSIADEIKGQTRKKDKQGKEILLKEEKDLKFLSDQQKMFMFYKSFYKEHLKRKEAAKRVKKQQ
jgi:hypothetical protein